MASSSRPNSHRRMRSLLRNYYGISEEPTSQNKDPMSLDSSSFDKERFLQKQLKTKKLSELVTTEVKLKKECDKLDSEMKTLVYENYNKFISATDTIQLMKTHIIDMNTKMDELKNKLDSISKSTVTINAEFAENRKDIEHYSGISSLLKKRQFLFELPSRLHKCIEMKAHAQAVLYYNKSKEILDKYKHLPSFGSIDKESIEIIENLKEILHDKMEKSSALPKTVTECTSLLLDLGEDSNNLRYKFLEWRGKDLQTQLTKYSSQSLPDLPKKQEKKQKNELLENSIDNNDVFSFNESSLELNNSLDKEESEELELNEEEIHYEKTALYLQQLNNGFLKELLSFSNSYYELFMQKIKTNNEKQELLNDFDKTMQPIFDSFILLVKDHLKTQYNSLYVLKCLELLGDMYSRISTKSKGMNMSSKVATILSNTIKAYMQYKFDIVLNKCSDNISELELLTPSKKDKINTSIPDKCDKIAKDIIGYLNDFIEDVMTYIDISDRSSYVRRQGITIWDLLHDFILDIAIFFKNKVNIYCNKLTIARKKSSDNINPLFLCVFSKLIISFNSIVIPHIENKILLIESILKENTPPKLTHLIKSFDIDELQSNIQTIYQLLLTEYVKDQGIHLSLMIQKGIETPDWSIMKEPNDVRLAVELVAREFQYILNGVSQIFSFLKDDENNIVSTSRYNINMVHFTQGKQTQIIGGIIDPNVNSILCGIIKIGLKSYIECVRLCTFSRFGYQQMQVDIEFLRFIWRELKFDNEGLVHRMLDDILESTTWRCIEPVSMNEKIIENICEKKVEKYQSQ